MDENEAIRRLKEAANVLMYEHDWRQYEVEELIEEACRCGALTTSSEDREHAIGCDPEINCECEP